MTCLRTSQAEDFNVVVIHWWEWLERILLTLLAMAAVSVTVAIPVALALLPSTVSDSNWHSEVVVPTRIAFGIGAGVSVVVGILVWRHYPSHLRHGGSTGGDWTRLGD